MKSRPNLYTNYEKETAIFSNNNQKSISSSLPKVNNFGKLVTERIKGFLKDDDLTEFKDENY